MYKSLIAISGVSVCASVSVCVCVKICIYLFVFVCVCLYVCVCVCVCSYYSRVSKKFPWAFNMPFKWSLCYGLKASVFLAARLFHSILILKRSLFASKAGVCLSWVPL